MNTREEQPHWAVADPELEANNSRETTVIREDAMKLSRRHLLGVVAALIVAVSSPSFAQEPKKPNIVVMLMDNLVPLHRGYDSLSGAG